MVAMSSTTGASSPAGIATAIVDHTAFGDNRESFERALDGELQAHRIDLVCLAGFMRLLTPWLVARWSGRMLNIHPALLPQLKGLHTHRRALAAGLRQHGATVHFVVPAMDSGPIVAQERAGADKGGEEERGSQPGWSAQDVHEGGRDRACAC